VDRDDDRQAGVRGARWLISGRVQGVGFRFHVWQAARRHGVRGEVRNLRDGTVEVRAEGTASTLKGLLQEVSRGPSGARVDRVETYELDARDCFSAFEIRH
jgi:acylphosphatase